MTTINWELVEAKLVANWGVSPDTIEVAKAMADNDEWGLLPEQVAYPVIIRKCTGLTILEWMKEEGLM